MTLNYIEHCLDLSSTISGCVSISAFGFLVYVPRGIKISAIGLKICAITAAIKKYKSTLNKKKKMHDQIVFLAKSKLNRIEVVISKSLIDSVNSHEEFVLINKFNICFNVIKG